MTGNRRYVESAALVSGSAAWLLSRILTSPRVRDVLDHAPAWIERGDITATVTAIYQAARAFETEAAARERDNAAPVSATGAQYSPEWTWTTEQAAAFLRISQRRAQELAPKLGAYRVGRRWKIPQVAVREYARRRTA